MNTTLPEVEGYIHMLRDLRADMLKACEGLSAEALNWKPPAPETNSIYVLATHTVGSERYWIQQVIGGIDVHRNRASEFVANGDDLSRWQQSLAEVAQQSEAVLRALSDADLRSTRPDHDETRTVQWCILHVIEHWSRHIGHVELTRQLWENQMRNS